MFSGVIQRNDDADQIMVPFGIGMFGGMGPLTGYDFFKLFIDLIPANSDSDHPDLMFLSLASIPRKDHCIEILEEKGAVPQALDARPGLKRGMDIFKAAKVRFVVAPCNTFHYFRENLQQYSGIEILDMISVVMHAILTKDPSVEKVGLLSTKATAKFKIYDKVFNNHKNKIEVIKPTAAEQEIVMDVINSVKEGRGNEKATEDKLIQVITALEMKGVNYIILGCTELPLVNLKNYKGKARLINSTLELAKATAYRACQAMNLDVVKLEALIKAKEHELLDRGLHSLQPQRNISKGFDNAQLINKRVNWASAICLLLAIALLISSMRQKYFSRGVIIEKDHVSFPDFIQVFSTLFAIGGIGYLLGVSNRSVGLGDLKIANNFRFLRHPLNESVEAEKHEVKSAAAPR